MVIIMHNKKLGLNNFTKLNEKVQKTRNRLALDSDMSLSDDDELDYIKIDRNNITIDGNNHSIDAKGKAGIFNVEANNVTLKNIVFKNAKSDDGSVIVNKTGSLNIINCKFIDNDAEFEGGAILNFADLKIENSKFENNVSGLNGGSINNKGILKAFDCKFNNNSSGNFGGAIVNWKKLSLRGCDFENNNAKRDGGAINNQKGIVVILNSKFNNNTSRENGGAIINLDELDVCGCEFDKNSADNCGGAIYNNFELRAGSLQFKNNESKIHGGAISNHNKAIALVDKCEFIENHAGEDGGAVNTFGKIKIENSNFTSNAALDCGGALRAQKNSYLYIEEDVKFGDNDAGMGGCFSAYAPAVINNNVEDIVSLHYNYFCVPLER